jgi:GDPmannose 4,6-dehydratase
MDGRMQRALITGISGQDGSYLAEFLLARGYSVHGLVTPDELNDPAGRLVRIRPMLGQVQLHAVDLQDPAGLGALFEQVQPDECYHLAAVSFVSFSPENEQATIQTNINGTHHILAALARHTPHCKFFFAASSEVFGRASSSPQDEHTPIAPRSVYGITKATGLFLTRSYREHQSIFACSGILYNHESERRSGPFVTKKIVSAAAHIKRGLQNELHLGNIDACRDWGYAPEYVEAMWLMLQQDSPAEYVIGTGQTHSVREFLQAAFETLDLDWQRYVVIDPQLFRPVETVELRANPAKARNQLGWQARLPFEELVRRMVLAEYSSLK